MIKEQDLLKTKDRYSSLLSIYQELLTDIVRERMNLFFNEDYSLSEIAENEEVSRNAVFESIISGKRSLDKYEDRLHLLEERNEIIKRLDEIKSCKDIEEKDKLIESLKGEIDGI